MCPDNLSPNGSFLFIYASDGRDKDTCQQGAQPLPQSGTPFLLGKFLKARVQLIVLFVRRLEVEFPCGQGKQNSQLSQH